MGKAKGKAKDERREAKRAKKDGKQAKRGKVKPKPKGMRWVSPYLTVKDVDRSLAWYERAFGMKTIFAMPGPDGKPAHAEMRHEKSVIMMGPESQEGRSRAPGKDGTAVSMYVYCRDVDAIVASARAQGATIAEEPTDQFWGDRTAFVIDPDGHQWMFATHVFDMDPDDEHCSEEECAACSEDECADDEDDAGDEAAGDQKAPAAKLKPEV